MGYSRFCRGGDIIQIGEVKITIEKGSPMLLIEAPKSMVITYKHGDAPLSHVELLKRENEKLRQKMRKERGERANKETKTEVIEKGQQISVEKQRLQAIDKILNNRGQK